MPLLLIQYRGHRRGNNQIVMQQTSHRIRRTFRHRPLEPAFGSNAGFAVNCLKLALEEGLQAFLLVHHLPGKGIALSCFTVVVVNRTKILKSAGVDHCQKTPAKPGFDLAVESKGDDAFTQAIAQK